jgi:ribonuclease BN (tRNA processing enzyme)
LTALTFLGTGNYFASKRYWNSFVVDGSVLVEPSPTVLPHLRRAGIPAAGLDTIVISHFHADHTFGWPFLLLELLREHDGRPLFVVGPPEVRSFLTEMTMLAGVPDVHEAAHAQLDLRYVEVDGSWQDAGPLRFRAVEVEHVPHLRCFGYLFDRGEPTIGYSGDTRQCPGLDEIAAGADAVVLECNGVHPWPTHMDVESVRTLRARFPGVRFLLSHLGDDVDACAMEGFTVPDDFETVHV